MQHIHAQLSEEATATCLARDHNTAMELWLIGLQYKHEDPKKLAIFEPAGHENSSAFDRQPLWRELEGQTSLTFRPQMRWFGKGSGSVETEGDSDRQ